ncbi:MAG TPA: hypothetical protein VNG69_04190 [Casimicrobiaceae bacterium]|nr:hypothetical protein [Casimicrobiaceae bacterium]
MEPLENRDRESRFQDACASAAAIVLVGVIIVLGEATMNRVHSQMQAEVKAANVAPSEYVPRELVLEAVGSGPHMKTNEE